MLFLFGGLAILCGFLLLGYLFVNADPARLARTLKWTAIVIAVLVVAGLVLTGREFILALPFAMGIPLFRRWRSLFAGFRSPSAGRGSTVATPFLRMTLDHDSGTMAGTILQGRFAGMRLEELGLGELLALLRECRAADEKGTQLLEAYLDRLHPEWRDELHAEGAHGSGGDAGGEMSADEAYAILGLAPGAPAAAIKEAHRRLMMKIHPDHGGSGYLATKINRARDVLLSR